MKKFALFSLVCCLACLGGMSASYATCGASTLGFDGLQDPDDDEFLYESWDQFDSTRSGYENSNHQTSGDGKGIECDTINSAGCPNRETVTLKAGHVFKGKVVPTQKTYKCTINLFQDDMWVEQAGEACEACETKWGDLCVGKSFANKTTVDCSGLNKTENNVDTVKTWQVICRPGRLVVCKPTKCKDGYKLDDKNGKCIKECEECDKTCEQKYKGNQAAIDCCNAGQDWNADSKRCICKDKSLTWNPSKKQCEKKSEPVKPGFCDKYKQWDKRYACCLAGKDTEWKGKDLSNDGTCVCKDGSKWEYNEKTKRGKCVANETPVPPVVEEEGKCDYYIKAGIKCANGNYYLEEGYQKVKRSDFEGKTCDEITQILDNDVNRLINTFKESCNEKQPDIYVPQPQTGPSEREVEQAQNVLSAFTESAKDEASVWKTSEGKFNTTRLASDITAGVVLGTVGGVVTGNIIKKNQVKKGFEALHCTVGGQKVADWGDEFSVGLRR